MVDHNLLRFNLIIISLTILGLLSLAPIIKSSTANQQEHRIVLTFDDGPKPKVLKELLPLLKKYDVPASFFVIGGQAANNLNWLKQENDQGHAVENHTYGHENLKNLLAAKGPEAIKTNLQKTAEVIFRATGREPRFFRPPYWVINDQIEKTVAPSGYKIMKLDAPDINTLDYDDAAKRRPAEKLIERVKRLIAYHEKRGRTTHILVFHELPITVQALEILIPYFQEHGYKFERLDKI